MKSQIIIFSIINQEDLTEARYEIGYLKKFKHGYGQLQAGNISKCTH